MEIKQKHIQLKFVYLAQMRNRVLWQINLADTTWRLMKSNFNVGYEEHVT